MLKSIATGVKLAYWSRFTLVRNIGWSYLRELRCAHQLDPGASRLDGRRRGVLHAAGRRWLARYGRRAQLQRLESFLQPNGGLARVTARPDHSRGSICPLIPPSPPTCGYLIMVVNV